MLYQTVELHHFIGAFDVVHNLLGIELGMVNLVNYTNGLATLIIPQLYLSKVSGCNEHVASLRVLHNVDEVRLSLAEGVCSEPVPYLYPLIALSCSFVHLGHVYWNAFRVHSLLSAIFFSKLIYVLKLSGAWRGSHACVKQDRLALITNYHHMITVWVDGPARVHLYLS